MSFWPTSVATDAGLYVAVNGIFTNLSAGVNNAVTTIPVASTTGFPATGGVVIDTEVIFYTSLDSTNFYGCTRGSDATTAAAHNSLAIVGADIIAFHHNGLMAEIEAIETSLVAAPLWTKFTVPYSSFSTSSTTNSINLGSVLPAGSIVTGCKIKHSTAFSGTSISACTVAVGVSGTLAGVAPAFDVFSTVTATNFQSSMCYWATSQTATTQLLVTATSVGANLSSLSAGSVSIWIQSQVVV